MSKLRLTLACWDYDRTRALADGTVKADGIDLNCISLPVEETFFRMLRYREFDVAEMSVSSRTPRTGRNTRWTSRTGSITGKSDANMNDTRWARRSACSTSRDAEPGV